jgi:Na+-driven multidrug efflux pump
MIFLVIPIVAVATIRSTGDTMFPALMMVGATGLNFVLDPLFIFGLWGFPRLEFQGAAIATVISRATTLVASLIVLHFREHLLDFQIPNLRAVWQSWRQIGVIAGPAIATNFMEPLGLGLITRVIADHGASSVAAWGAGLRITAFAMIPVFALGSGLVPFVGQNWGAGQYGRVRQARNYGYLFAMIWSVFVIILLHLMAEFLAHLFSIEPDVTREIVRYLWIIPFGYFGVSAYSITEETLNAIGRPILASLQTFIHLFVLYLPLAYLGAHVMSINGLFGGLVIADILGGAVGVGLAWWQCRKPDLAVTQNSATVQSSA